MSRYRTTYVQSREEKAREAVIKIGYDYMHGKVSIADIQKFLYSWEVVETGGYTETVKLIRQGVINAVDYNVVYDENDPPIMGSRIQPEQDPDEVAAIAARPRVRQKRYAHDKPYPKPFFGKETLEYASRYEPVPWYGVHLTITTK